MVLDRRAVDELPEHGIECLAGVVEPEDGAGAFADRIHLEAVPDDSGIRKRGGHPRVVPAREGIHVEVVEHGSIAVATREDRPPAQARLRAFEAEQLEEAPLVVERQSPLEVVVGDVQLVVR